MVSLRDRTVRDRIPLANVLPLGVPAFVRASFRVLRLFRFRSCQRWAPEGDKSVRLQRELMVAGGGLEPPTYGL